MGNALVKYGTQTEGSSEASRRAKASRRGPREQGTRLF